MDVREPLIDGPRTEPASKENWAQEVAFLNSTLPGDLLAADQDTARLSIPDVAPTPRRALPKGSPEVTRTCRLGVGRSPTRGSTRT